MTWSLTVIGSPEDALREIDRYSAELTGPLKEDFERAAPHLRQLVALNVRGSGGTMLHLVASGHRLFVFHVDGEETYSQVSVDLKRLSGRVVLPVPAA